MHISITVARKLDSAAGCEVARLGAPELEITPAIVAGERVLLSHFGSVSEFFWSVPDAAIEVFYDARGSAAWRMRPSFAAPALRARRRHHLCVTAYCRYLFDRRFLHRFANGRFVETGAVANIDRQRLISLIVGRSLSDHEKRPVTARGEVMFAAKSFSRGHSFRDINIDVARGEIVGLYGLLGSGRSEFVNAVYGNDPKPGAVRPRRGARRLSQRTPADPVVIPMGNVHQDWGTSPSRKSSTTSDGRIRSPCSFCSIY